MKHQKSCLEYERMEEKKPNDTLAIKILFKDKRKLLHVSYWEATF